MKILTVHGLGRQEKNPENWQPRWEAALKQVVARWNPTESVTVRHAPYDDYFGDTPMTVGGTTTGFGHLLWNELRYSVTDTVGGWFSRRRGFGDKLSETVKWRIGMVTQFADDEKLRARLRQHLSDLIREYDPEVIFAHSLGTLLTYDLFRNPPNNAVADGRYYITCGSQIGRAALRSLYGGRLETVAAQRWYNLYNKHDDVLVVPFKINADNFETIDTTFETPGIGDHDAIEYIIHPKAQDDAWRTIATAPVARGLRRRGATKAAAAAAAGAPVAPTRPRPTTKPSKRRALLVGINDYPNPDDRLEGCVNDVFRVSAALQQIGFDADDIRVVLNERATAETIRDRYAWVLEDPQPEDLRVFYYSGHGAQIPDYDGDEKVDHIDETLVAHDFDWDDRSTHLTDDFFNQLYAQLPYDMTFVAFFDCCHSGGIARAGGAKVRGINPPDDIRHRMLRWNTELEVWEPRDFEAKTMKRGFIRGDAGYSGKSGAANRLLRGVPLRSLARDKEEQDARRSALGHKGPYLPLIFEACSEDQFAYEYRDGVTSYGAYTYFLTKTLFDAGHAGRPFTFAELNRVVAQRIAKYYDQKPQLLGPKAWRNARVPWRAPGKKRRPGKATPAPSGS